MTDLTTYLHFKLTFIPVAVISIRLQLFSSQPNTQKQRLRSQLALTCRGSVMSRCPATYPHRPTEAGETSGETYSLSHEQESAPTMSIPSPWPRGRDVWHQGADQFPVATAKLVWRPAVWQAVAAQQSRTWSRLTGDLAGGWLTGPHHMLTCGRSEAGLAGTQTPNSARGGLSLALTPGSGCAGLSRRLSTSSGRAGPPGALTPGSGRAGPSGASNPSSG